MTIKSLVVACTLVAASLGAVTAPVSAKPMAPHHKMMMHKKMMMHHKMKMMHHQRMMHRR